MSLNNSHNRLRQLKGLVTIDPWHEGDPTKGNVTLHAYVHFDEGRLGGEAVDDIAFRVRLKSAEIRLLQSEPRSFEIDPAKIWRGDRDPSGKMKRTTTLATVAEGTVGASVEVSATPKLTASGNGKKASEKREVLEFETEGSSKTISVSFQRTFRDQPGWSLVPKEGSPTVEDIWALHGQPWDDKLQALLVLKPNKSLAERELLSSLKLCLLCRAEDIVFHDIMIRDERGVFVPIPDFSPKKLVAQEYLKRALVREGLHSGDFENPFALILLGEAVSEPRGNQYDEW